MEVVKKKLSEVHPDPANTRLHGPRNLSAVKSSLLEFDQYQPLVVQASTMRVIVGNCRYEAMCELHEEGKWSDEVDCVVVDVDDARAAALSITDNRTGELAQWDERALAEMVTSLQDEVDLGALGWADEEVDDLLGALDPGDGWDELDDEEPPDEFGEFDEDLATDYACPKCGYEWSGQPKPGGDGTGAS